MGLSNEYIFSIIKSSNGTELTKNTYITRLTTLTEFCNTDIYTILKKPDIFYAKIKIHYSKSIYTQKNIIATLLAIFKMIPILYNKKPTIYRKWKQIYTELKPEINTKELEITFDEIKQKYIELRQFNYKNCQTLWQEFLLLSMVVNLPRIKNKNYQNIAIITPPNHISPTKDYIVLKESNTSYFIYNKIKYNINQNLYEDLKYLPREYLFGPYLKTNSYNIFVIRVFEKMFKKRIGVNDLKKLT
jgi:hypothetical protein